MDICKHNENCGGCTYQGIAYEEQLKIKEGEALKLLDDCGLKPEVYDPIVGSSVTYRYRNKMDYTFGDFVKDGEMTLGMHKPKSFLSITTVDDCQLVPEDFNRILAATLAFCKERGYTHYKKKQHTGLMRHLILRCGVHTNEILVGIVTTGEGEGKGNPPLGTAEEANAFDEKVYVEMLQGLELDHDLVGVVRILNDTKADAVNCEEMRLLSGRSFYNEEIMGLQFQVGILSFFQTNIHAVERLYSDAINIIDDYGNKIVFDLFCGTGTISQSMALKAGRVVGVEIVEEAVEMARQSAKNNGIANCRFICGDVFEVLKGEPEKPDVIVVDPPRAGITNKALDRIASYRVSQIDYISCNYKTLFRDIGYLAERGYALKYLRFYDNFPFTKHVETVVLLNKVQK